jgi:hypothetical protein
MFGITHRWLLAPLMAVLLSASAARGADTLCDPSAGSCRTQLLTLIQNEQVGIDVSFWFMQDSRYMTEIVRRWQAGVPVRILMDTRANPSYTGNDQMPGLFAPLTLRSLTLSNRIVVSPMCEYCSVDGFSNDWHFVHLGSRAVGGAALVMTEAAGVTAVGRISPQDRTGSKAGGTSSSLWSSRAGCAIAASISSTVPRAAPCRTCTSRQARAFRCRSQSGSAVMPASRRARSA